MYKLLVVSLALKVTESRPLMIGPAPVVLPAIVIEQTSSVVTLMTKSCTP